MSPSYPVANKNASVACLVFPFLCVCFLFTLLQGWIPHWGAIWIFSLVGMLSSIFIIPEYYRGGGALWWFPYALIVFVNYLTGDYYWGRSFITPTIELTILCFAPAITFYVFKQSDKKTGDRVISWALLVLLITGIATLLLDVTNPGIVRQAAVARFAFQDDSLSQYYYRYAMSNYNLPHAIPTILPAFVYVVKNNIISRRIRFFFLLLIIVSLGLVFVSGAFTSLLLSIVSLLVSFLLISEKHKGLFKAIIIIFGIVFLISLAGGDIVGRGIVYFQDVVGEESFFYSKLLDAEAMLESGEAEGDMSTRIDLYSVSLSQGLSSVLIGTNGDIGGHSAIIDHFATLGIIGFIPFVLLLYSIIKKTLVFIPNKGIKYYSLGLLMTFAMLAIKSMSNLEVWFYTLTLLPLIIAKYSPK